MSTVSKKAIVQHTGGEIQRRMELLLRAVKTSNQSSHFVKFEKTQLSFFLCVKRDTAKNATELEIALTSCISTVDVAQLKQFCNILEI